MSAISHATCLAPCCRVVSKLLQISILLFGFFQTSPSLANSNILLEIVQQCLRTDTPAYCEQCRAPQQIANCPGKTDCRAPSEVWAENAEFVAIRDIKMCGCPPDFVHGLVMPKATVTGIEDSRRPDSIWSFSWQVALRRLKPGFHDKQSQHVVVSTRDLNAVWRLAQQVADERNMREYGVLVSAGASGEYWVTLTSQSSEGQFTQAVCTP